jgi:phosphatidylglycerophosphatase A
LGVGRIPVAPGTFGSILGLLWFALLLAGGNLWVLVGGAAAGLALSVWLGGAAENILGRTDPGCVVLDEITAMPVCFFGWVGIRLAQTGALPDVNYFLTGTRWALTLGIFAAFRFFDVVKPWPVRQSQALPGGWGITVDDVLAAVYVDVVLLAVFGVGLLRP